MEPFTKMNPMNVNAKYEFVCADCARTCYAWECMDWSEDPADRCWACTPTTHSCCGNKDGSKPVFDEIHQLFVYDPDQCRHRFSENCFPPLASWRSVEKQVEERYHPSVGQLILVGLDYLPYHTIGEDIMELTLRKEETGWSRHAVFYNDHHSSCLTFEIDATADTATENGIELQWMGPIGPPPSFHPMTTIHPVWNIEIYDPNWVMHMDPDLIPNLTAEGWMKAIDRILLSFELYSHPSPHEGDTILLLSKEVDCDNTLYTVRYLLHYTSPPLTSWKPFITVQQKGYEFLGYTYEWQEFEPCIDLSTLSLS